MKELTGRERATFDALWVVYMERGRAPRLRELAAYMERSAVTVHAHLESLVRKGWVKKANRRGWSKYTPSNTTTDDLLDWSKLAVKALRESNHSCLADEGARILRGMGVRGV